MFVMLTAVFAPPLEIFISMRGKGLNEKIEIPGPDPECSDRRTGFHPNVVDIPNTHGFVRSLDEVPARK